MCSILGYFNTSLSYKKIQEYNQKMSHRGPDNSCIKEYSFRGKKLFLGHNRLAIQDLDIKANQPMENEKFIIVFNGEIYNHFDLRYECGCECETRSDTETLLKLFTKYGIDKTINKLNGMFAIALFDKLNDKLYLIRDRVGIKPLYYTFQKDEFIFSSELKGIRDELKEVSEDSLIKFMSLGYIPNDKSYYKNIYKLKPAHYLVFDGKDITTKRYWNLSKNKIDISFNEAVEETHRLLKSSIKYRLLADVEVGAFLSGGIDSSLVSTIMAKESEKKIKTFTIGFKEEEFNEAKYAKRIAKHIGSEHYEYYFNSKDVLNLMEKIDYYYDEPFGDASSLPTMFLSKVTKNEVTVALSGDGGDELFLGYDRYFFTQNYYNKLKKIPFKTPLSKICEIIPYDKCKKMAYPIKNLTKENLYSVVSTSVKPWELGKLFNDEYIKETFLHLQEYDGSFETMEDLSRFDFYRYLPDDILVKVDRASMAYSLEARVPILDHRIVEFAYSLPKSIKLQNGPKSILKEIVYKYVTKELIDRPKMGFGVPLRKWFRNELKDILLDKINSLDERFNKDYLYKIFDAHQKGANYEYILWNLMRIK